MSRRTGLPLSRQLSPKVLLGFGAVAVLIAATAFLWRSRENEAAPASAASGDSHRASSPGSAAPAMPTAADAPPAPPGVQPEDERRRAMAEPFSTGRLPEPLQPVRGNPDVAAAALAAFIAARDDQSVPALLTAITTAGFAVRHEDGRLTQTITPGQGLVFDGWEVAAMAKMYGERRTLPLSRLTDDLRLVPGLADLPLQKLLIDGIAQQAASKQPQLRFMGRLVVELGRRAEEPYDLLASPDAAAVHLDPVQVALILRRLFGDFAAAAPAGAALGAAPAAVNAARAGGLRSPRVIRVASLQDPCSQLGRGETSMILDIAAIALGTGWGAVLDAVGPSTETYARWLAVANTLAAYAKLLLTYASIDTEISMDNPPLVRTTNAEPGERRLLTATVTVDSGGWDRYNCIRTALNVATGFDFSLIGDGPADGVELTWRVDNPGENFYSNRTGVTGNQPVVGITTGGPRIQDAGTYAGVGGSGTAVGDPTRSVTDESGRARIYLEGAPHIPFVSLPRMPVMKEARVRTNLKLKGGDIEGDAIDIAGQALGGVGAIASLPVELLFRVPWATVADEAAPVRDWETCTSDDWYGTMTTSTRFSRSSVEQGETAEVIIKHEARYTHDATVNVAGDTATATITSEELVASDQRSGYGHITHRRMSDGQYSGPVRAAVSVDAQLGTYDVGFERPPLTGTSRTTGTCERPAPYKCQPPSPSARPWAGDNRYLSAVTGTIDVKDPTQIRDTQTVKSGALEHTFTVSLQRCR